MFSNYVAYSGGFGAPIGCQLGRLTDNIGFQLEFRTNFGLHENHVAFNVEDGKIMHNYTDVEFIYDDKRQINRISFLFGANFKALGDLDDMHLHPYFGLGFGVINYEYRFREVDIASGQTLGTVWGEDITKKVESIAWDVGVVLGFSFFNIHIGLEAIELKRPMIYGGIGFNWEY
jgi:hypothetical protein